MVRELDTRDFEHMEATESRRVDLDTRARKLSLELPGEQEMSIAGLNAMTGSPDVLSFSHAPRASRSLVEEALAFARQASPVLGFLPEEPPEFVPDPFVQRTSVGQSVVHLHQYYRGVPVFQMQRTVRFSNSNEPLDMIGDNISIPQDFDIQPRIGPSQAGLAAAQYVASTNAPNGDKTDGWGQPLPPVTADTSGYSPEVLVSFPMTSRPTVLSPGPFADFVQAHLVLFFRGRDLRLGWHVLLTMPERSGQYALVVSAGQEAPGEILYCKDVMRTATVGSVYETNPGRSPRTSIPFPRPLTDYPSVPLAPLPSSFPHDWVTADETTGNSTVATLGSSATTMRGRRQGESIVFEPAQEDGDEQKILNIFYFCNYMHDFFYILGFDEASGNFQRVNFNGMGLPNDPVRAKAHSGAVWGTANMMTPADGSPPEMNMGLVTATSRHTAFDADVVFHEFAHGVTNRLVGGRMDDRALDMPQSGGMGEGWSDYFALTIQNYGQSTEKVVTGDWVTRRPGGIRAFPYDSHFPDHFGKIGTDRYTEVHNIGEIWCASLMEMHRRMGAALGSSERAHQLGWQIVVDSLKLSPANPSFLDARDAMLRALDALHDAGKISDSEHTIVRKAMWETFAKFGMGPDARSRGASLSGIVADFNIPEGL